MQLVLNDLFLLIIRDCFYICEITTRCESNRESGRHGRKWSDDDDASNLILLLPIEIILMVEKKCAREAL